MITKTTSEFEINLDPNDALSGVEFNALLDLMNKHICGFGMEWERLEEHKFEVSISTVTSP